MGNPGFARFEVQGIQIQVYRFCDLSYNLGQNKMEQQTPIPPKSRMKRREGQKRAIFLSLILGGRGGGLGFPFILSKIVAVPFKVDPKFPGRVSSMVPFVFLKCSLCSKLDSLACPFSEFFLRGWGRLYTGYHNIFVADHCMT